MLRWADETWQREVGEPAVREADPVAVLLTMARGHAVLCRRDIARVATALRVEFSGQDHRIARALDGVQRGLVERLARLITAGRRAGSIPPAPPGRGAGADRRPGGGGDDAGRAGTARRGAGRQNGGRGAGTPVPARQGRLTS